MGELRAVDLFSGPGGWCTGAAELGLTWLLERTYPEYPGVQA